MELIWTDEALAHFAHRGITLAHVNEALSDPYLLTLDPDPARKPGGTGIRYIGWCQTFSVLVVMGYEQDGDYYGSTAWKAKGWNVRLYNEQRVEMGAPPVAPKED